MPMNERGSDNEEVRRNRFSVRTGREPYSDRTEYLKALSDRLTPDTWDAIISRAIHDATLGRVNERAKAREWFAKYILPYKMEIELHKQTESAHSFLASIYDIFAGRARSNAEIDRGLAVAFAALSPEERVSLRTALANAEGTDAKEFWEDVNKLHEESKAEDNRKSSGRA